MTKTITSLSRKNKYLLPAGFVLVFAIIGVIILFVSHAATPYAAIEAETGATGGATSTSDSKASGGSYLQFGSESTTTPPPASGGCTSNGVVAPCIGSATTGASGWGKPIFDDEFSNDTKLNTSEWSTTCGFSSCNSGFAANVSVSGGYLNLYNNASTGEGSIVTTNPDYASPGFQFTYGYAEARFYVPGNSQGQIENWPSFWADGQDWPEDGEIDYMEGLNDVACAHFHWNNDPGNNDSGDEGWGPNGGDGCPPTGVGNVTQDFAGGWHTFAADWEPGIVTWYYDGIDIGCVETSGSSCGGASHDATITSSPMYLILTNGGVSGPAANTTMQVQYVRVWQ